MSDVTLSVLSSLLASGALSAAILWVSREWLTTRLRESIQHEYAQKLETLKAQLNAQTEISLIEARGSLERQAGLAAIASTSLSEGQKAAMERKLKAIDALWSRIVRFRSNLPPILGFVDILTIDEYAGMKNHPRFLTLSQGWTLEKVGTLIEPETEFTRPYIGEYLWALYFSYQAAHLRIVYLLHMGRDDSSKLEWHKDKGIIQLVSAVLDDAERRAFEAQKFGKVTWLQRAIEAKILDAIQQVISGEALSAESLEQAKRIQQKAADIPSVKTA
jgi:hypothetical protein